MNDSSILSRARIPLHELPWSARVANAFKNEGLAYLGDIAEKTGAELLRFPHLGRASVNEIEIILHMMGLPLGTKLPEGWRPAETAESGK